MLKRSPDTSDQDRPYAQPLPPFSWRSLHHVQEAHPLRLLMRRSTSSILLQALVIGRHTYCLNQKEASISSSPLSFPAVVVLAVTRRGAIITWLESTKDTASGGLTRVGVDLLEFLVHGLQGGEL
jgi:hypothetical protein